MRASGSERAIACPGSITLPGVRIRSRYTEQAADYGTAAHGWKELGHVPPGADAKHASLLLRKLDANPVDRDAWWPSDIGEHEATYALNLRTGHCTRYRGKRDGADAWKKKHGPEWLTGTIDYLAIRDDAVWVSDLKTGRDTNPDSAQLRSYVLLVWANNGRRDTFEFHTSIDHWPRYPVNSIITRYFNTQPITANTLLDHERRLRWSLDHPKEFTAGDHCQWCDGKPLCPIQGDTNGEER